jgi:hypothetical protein
MTRWVGRFSAFILDMVTNIIPQGETSINVTTKERATGVRIRLCGTIKLQGLDMGKEQPDDAYPHPAA